MAQDPLPVFVFGCTACGKTVAGTEKRCPRCGASFEDVKFECPFCGELTSPSRSKCDSCGTEFEAFAEEVVESSSIDLDGANAGSVPDQTAGGTEVKEESAEYECPNCGKPVGENDSKCPHCGVRFTEG
ncbi:MAG: zinc ribbon domain-containing protein [Candidatus Thermoplasmatota archaeon]|nr:zinc ribbon domain-containing protein [Candidatus Thermoplasmatota archaeon]